MEIMIQRVNPKLICLTRTAKELGSWSTYFSNVDDAMRYAIFTWPGVRIQMDV
jgi:hypothetical protein